MAIIKEKRNLCGLIIDATVSEDFVKSGQVTGNPISDGSEVHDHMFANTTEITLRALIGSSAPKNHFSNFPKRGLSNIPILKDYSSLENTNTDLAEYVRDFYPNLIKDSVITDDDLREINNNTLSVFDVLANATGGTAEEFSQDFESRSNLRQSAINDIGIRHFGSSSSSFDPLSNGRTKAAWCRLEELMDNKEICELVTTYKVYPEVVVTNISTKLNSENCEKLDVSITLREIKRVKAQQATIRSIDTGAGTSKRGEQKPKCLKLSDVFKPNDTNDGKVITEIINTNGLKSVNFSRQVWDEQICGKIGRRFKDILRPQLSIDQVLTTSTVTGLYVSEYFDGIAEGFEDVISFTNSSDGLSSTSVAQISDSVVQSTCRELLSENQYVKSCDIPERCRDSRYVRPDEENTSKTSSPVSISDDLSRVYAARNIIGGEVVSEDPASQYYYLDRDSSISNRDVFASDVVDGSDLNAQIERLNCYYCEVLQDLATYSNGILGSGLRDTLASDELCSKPFVNPRGNL